MGSPAKEATPLSETLEDYLEIILDLSLQQRTVRVRDIARAKGVRMPTVTAALRRLSERGLVLYQAREYVGLTEHGGAIARRVTGKHRFLSRFLTRVLGVPGDVADEDACGLEHHLSPRTLERLAAFVEYLETCPEVDGGFLARFHECFGKPEAAAQACRARACRREGVPTMSPRRGTSDLIAVSRLPAGVEGEIVRVRGPEKQRRQLLRRGLLPGALLRRLAPGGPGEAVRIVTQGDEISLGAEDAAAIFVEPTERT
jgi:DtxR family Mn-dependent transcriptional regulator